LIKHSKANLDLMTNLLLPPIQKRLREALLDQIMEEESVVEEETSQLAEAKTQPKNIVTIVKKMVTRNENATENNTYKKPTIVKSKVSQTFS